ncbi:MAG TPA: LacI family DNA-binding transcriptional regulator [Bryobacteraceae bacterium]|nr:LacI family DNA-binding transcriptional regulator [Bryobacteraceae bacterium]
MTYTMRDVARLAGVSIATVSAVLTGKKRVSDELRGRIEEAMRALDYHPDQVARSLKSGSTNMVGMVIPDVTNPFFTELMRGAEEEARRAGMSVMLCNTDGDPAIEHRQLNALLAHRVDGILLSCADSFTPWERLERRKVPFVFFDRLPVGYKGAGVALDNRAAAGEATRFLISLGHRRIAIIAGSQKVSPGIARLEGFREAMEAAHPAVRDQYVRCGDFSIDSGYRAALELIALPTPPTAILSCNNKMTLGLMRAMAEKKVSCPDAISVIGFDDFEWSANFSPRLTTVGQPTRAMGSKAMEMLLGQINGRHESPGTVMFPSELNVRDSTAPPKS